MNKRIKELAEQAGIDLPDDSAYNGHIYRNSIERFAESIVRECIEVVKWTPSLFPNNEYVKNIKEHFGVEE